MNAGEVEKHHQEHYGGVVFDLPTEAHSSGALKRRLDIRTVKFERSTNEVDMCFECFESWLPIGAPFLRPMQSAGLQRAIKRSFDGVHLDLEPHPSSP